MIRVKYVLCGELQSVTFFTYDEVVYFIRANVNEPGFHLKAIVNENRFTPMDDAPGESMHLGVSCDSLDDCDHK